LPLLSGYIFRFEYKIVPGNNIVESVYTLIQLVIMLIG